MKSEMPRFYPIKNGWAAAGKGWAVHGATKDEAAERFESATALHRVLDARVAMAYPGWHGNPATRTGE